MRGEINVGGLDGWDGKSRARNSLDSVSGSIISGVTNKAHLEVRSLCRKPLLYKPIRVGMQICKFPCYVNKEDNHHRKIVGQIIV